MTIIRGWSYDPDSKTTSIPIQIFVNAPAGQGTLFRSQSANVNRTDVNSIFGISGKHGFEIELSSEYKDGKKYSFYIYGIDLQDSNKSTLLPGSPKTYQFNVTPNTSGSGGGSSSNPVETNPTIIPGNPTTLPPVSVLPISQFSDGQLLLDKGVVYVMEFGKKRPFASMEVFNGFGYKLTNVRVVNTTSIPSSTGLFSANQRHVRGSLVVDNGTVYFIGSELRYAFPSAEIFLSWGNKFQEVVKANNHDLLLPIGPHVTHK